MSEWAFPFLRCPVCRGRLSFVRFQAGEGLLVHDAGGCRERYPVIGGIPRLLTGPARAELVRRRGDWFAARPETTGLMGDWSGVEPADAVITGFDHEWRRYREVGTAEQADLFDQYFDLVPDTALEADKVVLDAGAGAGRWAFALADRGPRVVAVDLGLSIEVTRTNTPPDRVACVQADVEALPLAAESVDWAYSLGVLHHTRDPKRGLANIADAVRPGGFVLLYLYYALEQRGPIFRGLFRATDLARRFLSRQPRPVTSAVTTALAALVYFPLARAAALLERVGARKVAEKMPLTFYRHLSFRTMRNDSLDRFGTRLERRYSRSEMTELMREAGLSDVRISNASPFWHGVARKARPDSHH